MPRDFLVVLVFEFHRHADIPVLLCERFLYVICQTAKTFWKLTSVFFFFIKKKSWLEHCVFSVPFLFLFPHLYACSVKTVQGFQNRLATNLQLSSFH